MNKVEIVKAEENLKMQKMRTGKEKQRKERKLPGLKGEKLHEKNAIEETKGCV